MKNRILFMAIAGLAFALSTLSEVFSQTIQTSDTYVTGMTSGRARSLIGVVFGLASLIIGLKGKKHKRILVITALLLGSIAVILSVIHLANLTGGFGTGVGKAGGIVALVLGLVGCLLNINALRMKSDE